MPHVVVKKHFMKIFEITFFFFKIIGFQKKIFFLDYGFSRNSHKLRNGRARDRRRPIVTVAPATGDVMRSRTTPTMFRPKSYMYEPL